MSHDVMWDSIESLCPCFIEGFVNGGIWAAFFIVSLAFILGVARN